MLKKFLEKKKCCICNCIIVLEKKRIFLIIMWKIMKLIYIYTLSLYTFLDHMLNKKYLKNKNVSNFILFCCVDD